MNAELQRMCMLFIEGKEEVRKAFMMELDPVCSVCSDIFLLHGKRADAALLKKCKGFIKKNAGAFSSFRGSMYAPTAAMLACSGDPEAKMEQAASYYQLLKEYFPGSSQLVLAALILTEIADPSTVREKAARGKRLYQMLKEKHRFLTDSTDSVFAVMMAFSAKSDAEIIDESEECLTLLSGLGGKDYLQTTAMILSMDRKSAEEKCQRFRDLFEMIRTVGMRYGRSYELPVLATLAAGDAPIGRLVADIADAEAFLHTQRGYKGVFGNDKQTRFMHAAMLVSACHSATLTDDVAAITSALTAVAIQMLMMYIMINNTALITAASGSH